MEIEVTTRGEVAEGTRQLARAEMARLERLVKGPVLGARVVLIEERNPRVALSARAEGEFVLAGRAVHARAAAESMDAAVDELGERLGSQVRRHLDRTVTRRREPAASPAGEWRHASLPTTRPERSFLPPEERRIERRKTFAFRPMAVTEAVLEIEALDHEFFLYRDVETGADALLYVREDGRLGLIDPAGTPPRAGGPEREPDRLSRPIGLRTAVREMDELGHRFLFFVNENTGHGNVIYLRFDGHYGLIEPSS
jgi:ribosome-associated translation inhibitor RaiA